MAKSFIKKKLIRVVNWCFKWFAKRTVGWKIYKSEKLQLTLLLDVDNFVDFIIYKHGVFEEEVLKTIVTHANCRIPVLFVDVGAHIGQMSLYVAKHLPNVSVVAFEPEPDSYVQHTAEQLINDLSYPTFQLAAGASYGEEKIYVPNVRLPEDYGKLNNGMATLIEGRISSGASTKLVKTVPLANFLPKHINTAAFDRLIFKIDVEGDEMNVVRGLAPLLEGGQQEVILIIELLFDESRNDCIQLYHILSSMNYWMYTLSSSPIVEADLTSLPNGNYLFTNNLIDTSI